MIDTESLNVLLNNPDTISPIQGKTLVIKYGGNAMESLDQQYEFARQIVLLHRLGAHVIIVHGGGPHIQHTLESMGITSHFEHGMRVTDAKTMQVVQMVLVGQVNKHLVALLNQNGAKAAGFCGIDNRCIQARKMTLPTLTPVDLGQVGEVIAIDSELIEVLIAQRFIPVMAPVGVNASGDSLNINADLVAGHIAGHLKADQLLLLTNTAGLLDQNKQPLEHIHVDALDPLIADGTISGGMLPKVDSARIALKQGVASVCIMDGRQHKALLTHLLTPKKLGTSIIP